jgi:hypothetical protein
MPWRDAQQHEQDRGEHAYRLVAGEDAYEECGYAHDQERRHQHGLAPDLVPVVAEDHAA